MDSMDGVVQPNAANKGKTGKNEKKKRNRNRVKKNAKLNNDNSESTRKNDNNDSNDNYKSNSNNNNNSNNKSNSDNKTNSNNKNSNKNKDSGSNKNKDSSRKTHKSSKNGNKNKSKSTPNKIKPDGVKEGQIKKKGSKKERKNAWLIKNEGKSQRRKQFGTKQVFASMYAPAFPSYDPNLVRDMDIRKFVTEALTNAFKGVGSGRHEGIVMGINEVTKGLERRELQMVITCRDISPMVLIAHLPALCYVSRVGMVIFQGDANQLGQLVYKAGNTASKVSTVLALGIRKNHLSDLVNRLSVVTVSLDFPWLNQDADPVDEEQKKEQEKNNEALKFNFPFPAPRMIPHRKKADRNQVTQQDCMSTPILNGFQLSKDTKEKGSAGGPAKSGDGDGDTKKAESANN